MNQIFFIYLEDTFRKVLIIKKLKVLIKFAIFFKQRAPLSEEKNSLFTFSLAVLIELFYWNSVSLSLIN